MTGINHATTGALIGAAVAAPEVALALALLSHFVLDALPHYGDGTGTTVPASRQLRLAIRLDFALVVALLAGILLIRPEHWPVMLAAALLAMSPDLMWLSDYLRGLRNLEPRARSFAKRMHHKIQWCERPWGIAVEAVWIVGVAALLARTA